MRPSDIIVDCRYSDAVVSRPLELHDAFELGYLKQGVTQASVSKRQYLLEGPSLFFASKFEPHSFRVLSGEYLRFYILLTPNNLERLVEDPRLMSIFRNRSPHFRHGFPVTRHRRQVEESFAAILQEYQNGESYAASIIKFHLNLILVYAFRECRDNFSSSSEKTLGEIYEIQRYLEENYDKDILIREVAESRFLSSYYLSHAFKRYTGYSPKQYLQFVRMSRAREKLLMSDLSVQEVAERCGFHSASNFVRVFRAEHGVSPLQYKKQKLHIIGQV